MKYRQSGLKLYIPSIYRIPMKALNFNLEDEVYFKLLELKAKLHARDWQDFVRKVLEHYGNDGNVSK